MAAGQGQRRQGRRATVDEGGMEIERRLDTGYPRAAGSPGRSAGGVEVGMRVGEGREYVVWIGFLLGS